jgi:hypothetical protein
VPGLTDGKEDIGRWIEESKSSTGFLSRSDIAVEKEDRSLYLRALLPDTQDTLFVVGESGTTYEINLSTSDKPDRPFSSPTLRNRLKLKIKRPGRSRHLI